MFRDKRVSIVWCGALAILLGVSIQWPVQALHEPTVVSLGISAKGPSASLIPLIEKRLSDSRRFRVHKRVTPPSQPFPWPETAYREWRKQTQASAALLGETAIKGNRIELTCRLVDLRRGFESKELVLGGDRSALNSIAEQTVRFLRVNYPLQAQITTVRGKHFVLDVGSEDGVVAGDRFILWRLPESSVDQVAVFEITSASAWYSEAILTEFHAERMQGMSDAADLRNWKGKLIEDVSSILLGRLESGGT